MNELKKSLQSSLVRFVLVRDVPINLAASVKEQEVEIKFHVKDLLPSENLQQYLGWLSMQRMALKAFDDSREIN